MNLSNLYALTTIQRDECREKAVKRVQRHLGEKPTRAKFQRELGRLWTVLDVLAVIVFIAALTVSSIHIVTHTGAAAALGYTTVQQSQFGTYVGVDLFVAAHQWAYIFMAEGSMILFLVLFAVTDGGWRRWVFLMLAVLSVVFVLKSNLSSGLGLLESALAPAFTIGIGLKLELLILQYLKRGRDVNGRYLQALAIWEAATSDPETHPHYQKYLMNEIWTALIKPQRNQWAIEAAPDFKRAAVARELARENWTEGTVEPVAAVEAPVSEEVQPERVAIPFGVGGDQTLDESGSMPLMHSANGRTVAANEN